MEINRSSILSVLGLNSAWMGDCLCTPDAAGMGLDIDSAKRQTDNFVTAPSIGGCIVPVSTSGRVSPSC